MFRRFATLTTRHRYAVIFVWVAAAVILNLFAPPLEDVSSTDQRDFLPADAPFAQAQATYEAAFPAQFGPSSTMLVIDAGPGGSVRDPQIWAWMQSAADYLASDAAPEEVDSVTAPTTDPTFADALISPDGQVALISATLSTPTDAIQTVAAVKHIDRWLDDHAPQGFDVYQTGEAGLNAQAEESTFTTMDRTIVITFALVIVALLVIYRSPVSPLIPLFSVTVAFLVTIGLLANLADLGLITVVAQVNAILVVVMYGAGTDYCLFLISRFREEMADEIGTEPATRRTIRRVGEAISTSAGTTTVGFLALLFAEMGMFRSAGPMLAVGVVISLLAGLTLTPALLALLGNRAFWPFKASHRDSGRFYAMTSKLVSSRPLVTIGVIVLLMLPFSLVGLGAELNFDFVSELPEDMPAVQGYIILGEHMGAGNLFPLTVVVTGRDAEAAPREIAQLTDALLAVENVVDVRGLDSPLGTADPAYTDMLRVEGQLRLLLADDGGSDVGTLGDAEAALVGLREYLDLLAAQWPEVADDPHLTTLYALLDDGLMAIATQEEAFNAALAGLAERFASIDNAYLLPPTDEGALFADLDPLLTEYLALGGTAYRLDVVLADPLATEGQDAVVTIREVLGGYTNVDDGGEAVVSGFPAVTTDIKDALGRDTVRIYALVLGGVFVMLAALLRSLVAPLYLIGTVILSYTTTMGITLVFFRTMMNVEKLSWLLPVFLFVFLVALGIDYSIFLFSRIREEVGGHGIREGVHVAVAATGAIITSAAVILAGTFAGMMAGELLFLAQLGFAVSIGVMIDALVVRTILDPALATAFGRWTWWPGGVPGEQDAAPASTVQAQPGAATGG